MAHTKTLAKNNKTVRVCIAVGLIAIIGSLYIVFSRGATPVYGTEAETGTVAAPAIKLTDASASGGTAVVFKNNTATLLTESFDGPDGTFVSGSDFWCCSDLGASKNPDWMSESGNMYRRSGTGTADNSMFRMWTRRSDLQHTKMELDVKYHGFFSGDQSWHGINLWLQESYCTPEDNVSPCTKVNDGNGPSGYAVDFMNRGGYIEILKKVKGDTRVKWPTNATSYAAGGTYYRLTGKNWSPVSGQPYKFGGQTVANSDGSTTIRLLIDGQIMLEYRDNGSVGGPPLTGGRVGLRSDFANFNVDNIRITRN